jgi:hypothetical protein
MRPGALHKKNSFHWSFLSDFFKKTPETPTVGFSFRSECASIKPDEERHANQG